MDLPTQHASLINVTTSGPLETIETSTGKKVDHGNMVWPAIAESLRRGMVMSPFFVPTRDHNECSITQILAIDFRQSFTKRDRSEVLTTSTPFIPDKKP